MCYASPFVELLGLTTPVFLPSGLKTGVVPLESWHETPSFQTGFTPMAPRMNTITAQSAPMLASQLGTAFHIPCVTDYKLTCLPSSGDALNMPENKVSLLLLGFYTTAKLGLFRTHRELS